MTLENKKLRKFDLNQLECDIQNAYESYLKDKTNQESIKNLFLSIKSLAWATTQIMALNNSYNNIDLDYKLLAYEYSTYLLERIITGKWAVPTDLENRTKFAWNNYIRVNIKHVLFKNFIVNKEHSSQKSLHSLPRNFISLDEIIESIQEEDNWNLLSSANKDNNQYNTLLSVPNTLEDDVNDNTELQKAFKFLKLIYGDDYYRLASELLTYTDIKDLNKIQDDEVRDFAKLSSVVLKRLYETYQLPSNLNNVNQVLGSTFYLASLLSSDSDKRLFLSLDFANLYRLVSTYGGQELRIPTINELEDLIAAASAACEYVTTNTKKSLTEVGEGVKKEHKFTIRQSKLETNVKKLILYLLTQINDNPLDNSTQPIVNTVLELSKSIKPVLDKLLVKIERKIDVTNDSEQLIEIYKELTSYLGTSFIIVNKINSIATNLLKECQISNVRQPK